MVAYLPRYEFAAYVLVYLSFLVYGIYQIIRLDNVISSNTEYAGFSPGWSILNRKQDNLDFEWSTWKQFTYKNTFWYLGHVILSEVARILPGRLTKCVHIIIGGLFILYNYNLVVLTVIVIKMTTFYLLMSFRSRTVLWAYAGLWLFIINFCKSHSAQEQIKEYVGLEDEQVYEIVNMLCWNLLKLLSVSLENIGEPTDTEASTFYGYVLYYPNMTLGPIVIFGRYKKMLYDRAAGLKIGIIKRLFKLIRRLICIGFWLLLTDFALHYIYLNNLQNNIKIVQMLNSWSLYAFGYLMGQFFHNKYVIWYGISLALAQFDGMEAPGLPKCIGRIHLYSEMWKYFDQGLYEFLFIHIYASLCAKCSTKIVKFMASLVTFMFIYLWHGFYQFVLIWSILNFVVVQVEQLARAELTARKELWDRYISPSNQLRLTAVLGSQLFIPAAISNFFFFGGMEVGTEFMMRTYWTGTLSSYLILSGCCYCLYHTAEVIKRREIEQKCIKDAKKVS